MCAFAKLLCAFAKFLCKLVFAKLLCAFVKLLCELVLTSWETYMNLLSELCVKLV